MFDNLQILPNSELLVRGVRCRVVSVLGSSRLIVDNLQTGQRETAGMDEARPLHFTTPEKHTPLENFSDLQWKTAEQRYQAILPLLAFPGRTKAAMQERAIETSYGITSLYKWLRLFETSESMSSLAPKDRPGGRGKSRLSSEQDSLVMPAIEKLYLTDQKRSTKAVFREIQRMCAGRRIVCPSINTIRERIKRIDPAIVARRRLGPKAGRSMKPIRGSFPGADHPLDVVQVDHTRLDIQVVDEKSRLPTGRRPFITVALDVYSRMIVGYYISDDPVGDLSTGVCLIHSMLSKKEWLAAHEITADWPCQGIMRALHLDNAREFHSKMLRRACSQYGIRLDHRPVARPHYGGNIERLIKTLVDYLHTLPGTTFSNPREKGEYNSEQKAVFTMRELEKIIALWITTIYHGSFHQGISTTPLERYRRGILGLDTSDGPAEIRYPTDPIRLRLDLLPGIERSVQPYGVVVDEVFYYHDILRPWINATDPANRKKKRVFLFKRDPRDISIIYFFDPSREEYHPIPYRDITHPAISIGSLESATSE